LEAGGLFEQTLPTPNRRKTLGGWGAGKEERIRVVNYKNEE
jgi:hypothetical protein